MTICFLTGISPLLDQHNAHNSVEYVVESIQYLFSKLYAHRKLPLLFWFQGERLLRLDVTRGREIGLPLRTEHFLYVFLCMLATFGSTELLNYSRLTCNIACLTAELKMQNMLNCMKTTQMSLLIMVIACIFCT